MFQTLPKVLTLWLEHASIVEQPFDPKRGDNEYEPSAPNCITITNEHFREFQKHSINQRKKSLDDMHSQLKKYLNRMPAALVMICFPFLHHILLTVLAVYNPSSSCGSHLSHQPYSL